MKNYGVRNSNMPCCMLFCADAKSFLLVIDLNEQVSSFGIAYVITWTIAPRKNNC